MSISSLDYFVNDIDWTAQTTTSESIATNFYEISKLSDEDLEKNENLIVKFKNKIVNLGKTNPRKFKAVKKAFEKLVDRHNKELDRKHNENLIKHNLKMLKPYLKKEEFTKLVEQINTANEAFIIASHFAAYANDVATRILNRAEFKKTSNNTRDRNLLIKKLKKLKLDNTIIVQGLEEYDNTWTKDEYLKVCKDVLFETLTNGNGTGKDRAHRISSRVKKAIKNYHTK